MVIVNENQIASTKFELWKHIDCEINKIESSYPTIFSIFLSLIGFLFLYVGNNVQIYDESMHLTESGVVFLIFLPVAVFFMISYVAYSFRKVATMRGYLIRIEHDINSMFNENEVVSWYSKYYKEFIAHKRFINNFTIPLFVLIIIAGILAYACLLIARSQTQIVIKTVWIILNSVLFGITFLPFTRNYKIEDMIATESSKSNTKQKK